MENIKKLREAFTMENITQCHFATNGIKLLVGANNTWHIFDIETGKWSFDKDVINC